MWRAGFALLASLACASAHLHFPRSLKPALRHLKAEHPELLNDVIPADTENVNRKSFMFGYLLGFERHTSAARPYIGLYGIPPGMYDVNRDSSAAYSEDLPASEEYSESPKKANLNPDDVKENGDNSEDQITIELNSEDPDATEESSEDPKTAGGSSEESNEEGSEEEEEPEDQKEVDDNLEDSETNGEKLEDLNTIQENTEGPKTIEESSEDPQAIEENSEDPQTTDENSEDPTISEDSNDKEIPLLDASTVSPTTADNSGDYVDVASNEGASEGSTANPFDATTATESSEDEEGERRLVRKKRELKGLVRQVAVTDVSEAKNVVQEHSQQPLEQDVEGDSRSPHAAIVGPPEDLHDVAAGPPEDLDDVAVGQAGLAMDGSDSGGVPPSEARAQPDLSSLTHDASGAPGMQTEAGFRRAIFDEQGNLVGFDEAASAGVAAAAPNVTSVAQAAPPNAHVFDVKLADLQSKDVGKLTLRDILLFV